MKKYIFFFLLLFPLFFSAHAQADSSSSSFWKPSPRSYEAKRAWEYESLVPMFFTGGFHFALCYRFERFRLRASVINGGRYDAEPAGTKNSSDNFRRYYKTSPGVFFGYNLWRNLEVYTYLEWHTFAIEQKSSGSTKDLRSTDCGAGISYAFFLGRYFYIQPGLHVYLRRDHSLSFANEQYQIPNVDISPVLRLGYRFWSR